MGIEIEVEEIEQSDTRQDETFDSGGACKILILGGANLGLTIDFNGLGTPFDIRTPFLLDSGDPKEELDFTGVLTLTPNNPLTKNKKITILRFIDTP